MPELTLARLAEAVGGHLAHGDPETRVRSFDIDTRGLKPGGAFFALRGGKTDGHRFLGEAARNGAAAAVVQLGPGPDDPAPPGIILVPDTEAALIAAGHWLRRNVLRSRCIALTGSNGKTTTKELLAEGLAATRRVHRTRGNFNNHLGVPLTLLACPDDVDYMVVELAMSAAGEIAELARMTDPDIGLVTNIRAVHLEFFRSLDDIAAAKGELFAVLRDEAASIVNLDDPHVRVQAARHVGPRVTFGQNPSADLHMLEVVNRFVPGVGMTFEHAGERHHLELSMGGSHAAFDALAALAAIVAAGEPLEPAMEAMSRLEAGDGRGRVHHLQGGLTLVDDSYNSSPAAIASVLETLRASESRGRKVLVMGDMLELGAAVELAMHREAGKRAAAAGVDVFFGVGTLSRQAADTARRGGVGEVHQYSDANRCAESIAEFLREGDLIVVKGSRRLRLEKVVAAVTEAFQVRA